MCSENSFSTHWVENDSCVMIIYSLVTVPPARGAGTVTGVLEQIRA